MGTRQPLNCGNSSEEERKRMQLSEYVGQQIIINAQPLGGLQQVKLLGVEAGGVWIESQEITNQFLAHFRVATAPNTFVFFLPYGEIEIISVHIPTVGLNETAFDV
jgi:hypothetical protein